MRTNLGVADVSTLAKFEIAGPDAAALLERVCATRVRPLKVGHGRYTFMLREDGLVMDDGTVWRLAEDRYFLTASTGGAERMAGHIAYVRRVLAPSLGVAVFDVQEAQGAIVVAGPRSPGLVEALTEAPAPLHMRLAFSRIAGRPVKMLSASYSGERAFEIYAPACVIGEIWDLALSHARQVGGVPYGLEALELLRIEKGHVEVGAEIDGRRAPMDLGLHKLLNPEGGYVGDAALRRPALHADDRAVVVGLEAEEAIPEGAMIVARPGGLIQGHVTSAGRRVTGEGFLALALLRRGRERAGETLLAVSPTRRLQASVRVRDAHFYDPKGERYVD